MTCVCVHKEHLFHSKCMFSTCEVHMVAHMRKSTPELCNKVSIVHCHVSTIEYGFTRHKIHTVDYGPKGEVEEEHAW